MTSKSVNDVAELLIDARTARTTAAIPNMDPPRDNDTAYAIQDAVIRSLGRIGAWKVGASSPEAEPLCAPLPEALVFPSPLEISADRFTTLGVECEIAFRIGHDLPARDRPYERQEVMEAISAVLPAIEIVDSRWDGWPDIPAGWHLADHQANGALVCGPEIREWQTIDLLHQPVRLTLDGRTVVETVGGNKGGDVIRLVTWLANHAATRNGGLRNGDVVTTGSCTGVNFAEPGSRVVATFGDIGEAEVTFRRNSGARP